MPDRDGTRVLVVDDDEAVRDSVSELLESHGYAVTSYDSATAFLEDAHDGNLCLLLDIRMPDIYGLTLLGKMAQARSRIPVIMMTGHGDVPTAVRAMKLGAFEFLEKPCASELLLDTVRRALDRAGRNEEEREFAELAAARAARLTPREREVMDWLVEGLSSKEIARKLDISPRTVEIHRARVLEKMEAKSLSLVVRSVLLLQQSERAPDAAARL